MLELNTGEQIDSWDVVITTTSGYKISCCELGLDLSDTIMGLIDESLAEFYDCTWTDPVRPVELAEG